MLFLLKKSKNTCLEHFGVEFSGQSPQQKSKMKQTNLKLYGNACSLHGEEVQKKVENTLLKHYGVKHYAQSEEFHHRRYKRYFYDNIYFYSQDELAFYIFHKDKNYVIEIEPVSLGYVYKNKTYKYFPDFKINNKLIEIKGMQFLKEDGTWFNPYRKSNWTDEEYKESCEKYEAKHQCALANNVEIIYDCKEYIKYVKETYGKNYLKQFLVDKYKK